MLAVCLCLRITIGRNPEVKLRKLITYEEIWSNPLNSRKREKDAVDARDSRTFSDFFTFRSTINSVVSG